VPRFELLERPEPVEPRELRVLLELRLLLELRVLLERDLALLEPVFEPDFDPLDRDFDPLERDVEPLDRDFELPDFVPDERPVARDVRVEPEPLERPDCPLLERDEPSDCPPRFASAFSSGDSPSPLLSRSFLATPAAAVVARPTATPAATFFFRLPSSSSCGSIPTSSPFVWCTRSRCTWVGNRATAAFTRTQRGNALRPND
jgi:hypothetical protein